MKVFANEPASDLSFMSSIATEGRKPRRARRTAPQGDSPPDIMDIATFLTEFCIDDKLETAHDGIVAILETVGAYEVFDKLVASKFFRGGGVGKRRTGGLRRELEGGGWLAVGSKV